MIRRIEADSHEHWAIKAGETKECFHCGEKNCDCDKQPCIYCGETKEDKHVCSKCQDLDGLVAP